MRIVRRILVCLYIVVYVVLIKLIGVILIFERFFVYRIFKNSFYICIKFLNFLFIYVVYKKLNMMVGILMKIFMIRFLFVLEK